MRAALMRAAKGASVRDKSDTNGTNLVADVPALGSVQLTISLSLWESRA
jgi:hypothetical protein